ncbi:MAG: TetR/AcrR family transcriptional regulator [Vallitalea sp.]|nr:TetR/AcrR family transcriptional regulator [Vallitalea sp.]
MSVQDVTLNPKILESATKEFLDKGFLNASVKEICEKAGVTTGALYKRYKGKAELFDAVVEPIYQKLDELGADKLTKSVDLMDDDDLTKMWDNPEQSYISQTNFFYDNYLGMKLLLSCSEGTKHSNFFDNFVKKNTEIVYEFSKEVFKRGLSDKLIDEDILHMLLSAYWSSLFEPIIHGYSKEKAISASKILANFFDWKNALGY